VRREVGQLGDVQFAVIVFVHSGDFLFHQVHEFRRS
jgi:hypothetical protein